MLFRSDECVAGGIAETTMEPRVEPLTLAGELKAHPSVVAVNYNLSELRILLSVNDDSRIELQVLFRTPAGFRVLDESDLLEFWENHKHGSDWLYLVHEGGWNDLESSRDGYLSRHQTDLNEYLIVGRNECVSILSYEQPVVLDIGSKRSLLQPGLQAKTARSI